MKEIAPFQDSKTPAQDSTAYERIAMSFFCSGQPVEPRMFALCAEPGMGRRDIITGVLGQSEDAGLKTLRRNLYGRTPEEASRLLTRVAREVSYSTDHTVVAFDEIPPSDEACVARQARALRRVLARGHSVVFSLAPEGRQLLEALPECRVAWSSDFLAQGLSEIDRSGCAQDLRALTRGIPSLIRALGPLSPTLSSVVPSQAFYDALADLVTSSVRDGLPDTDLRLRLAMLLLGRGTVDDLADVVETRDLEDSLSRIFSDAPLFGVSSTFSSFQCVCDDLPLALAVCLPRLNVVTILFPEVLSRSVRRLICTGRFERAASICRLMGRVEAADLVLENGAEFLEVGETSLVRRAVEGSGPLVGPGAADVSALGLALRSICRRRLTIESLPETTSLGAQGRGALMFVDARMILRGEPGVLEAGLASDFTGLSRLATHRRACDLLMRGLPNAAMKVLVVESDGGPANTVSKALISVDLEMTRLLMGDSGDPDDERTAEAVRFLSSSSLDGLSAYPEMVRVVGALMRDEPCAAAEAEALSARAERSGDVLPHVVALLAGCVCDLRRRAYARANVRSLLASGVAEDARLDYLARVAALLGIVARFMLGDQAEDWVVKGDDDLALVCGLVYEAMTSTENPLSASGGRRDVPRDALWLLKLLSYGMGELSELLRGRMPPGWRRALLAMEGVDEGEGDMGGAESVPSLLEAIRKPPLGDPSIPIEISLLGGYAVYVRGIRIPDWKLEHRSAKSMLEYLVLQHGASAKRFQLVEQVWPDCDYATGFNRAYQATSSLRNIINEIEPGLDPFVTSRMSKEISLDMGLVRCDVDVFRAIAREASDCMEPQRALALARQAEKLYSGDLYMPLCDSTGFIAGFRAELRSLYADAMVAGGDAALRLGHERTAARLASNALMADDLREDAVIVLVSALQSSGRGVEADRQYRQYRSRLKRSGSRAPSRRLCAIMGEGEGGAS